MDAEKIALQQPVEAENVRIEYHTKGRRKNNLQLVWIALQVKGKLFCSQSLKTFFQGNKRFLFI